MSSAASKASATKAKPIKYTPPPPAPLPADYDEFFASMTAQERELFDLAREKLGSSFFVQWSHLYKRWSAAKAKKG
jgi:hypothetical protein